LIENPLTSETYLDNLWHGGCWRHDICGYVAGKLAAHVDLSLSEHSIYRLSVLTAGQAPFTIRTPLGEFTADRLSQVHAHAATKPMRIDPTLGVSAELAIATHFDLEEALRVQHRRVERLSGVRDRLRRRLSQTNAQNAMLQRRCSDLQQLLSETNQHRV